MNDRVRRSLEVVAAIAGVFLASLDDAPRDSIVPVVADTGVPNDGLQAFKHLDVTQVRGD